MPMFARVECVFVLRESIRCMNDYTWRRRRLCSSHTAHRQIRHPVDPHAPSLPSLFGTFMLAIESPNEDLGRNLTEEHLPVGCIVANKKSRTKILFGSQKHRGQQSHTFGPLVAI